MLIVVSPAKTLDFEQQSLHKVTSKPELLAHSKKLIAQLREFSPKQLSKLMSISDKLADEVHAYVTGWKAKYDTTTAKQALLAFRGDVYWVSMRIVSRRRTLTLRSSTCGFSQDSTACCVRSI